MFCDLNKKKKYHNAIITLRIWNLGTRDDNVYATKTELQSYSIHRDSAEKSLCIMNRIKKRSMNTLAYMFRMLRKPLRLGLKGVVMPKKICNLANHMFNASFFR